MTPPIALVNQRGGRFATELGIDLASPDANERFRWLIAAVLYGARISEAVARRTWQHFARRGVLTPQRILETGWDGLVALLDAGGYARYDYKTATKLSTLSRSLLEHYGGNLDTLHAAARDARDLEQRLHALAPGIGAVTVQIFLRELAGIWPKAAPPLSELALVAARALGYVDPDATPEAARRRLEALWKASAPRTLAFADFESALVREGLRMRRAASGAQRVS